MVAAKMAVVGDSLVMMVEVQGGEYFVKGVVHALHEFTGIRSAYLKEAAIPQAIQV